MDPKSEQMLKKWFQKVNKHVEKLCPGRSWGVRGAQDAQKLWILSGFGLDLVPFGELFGDLFVFFLGPPGR